MFYVEYNAYISKLLRHLSEKEIINEFDLYNRAVVICKCENAIRDLFRVPNAYKVNDILYMRSKSFSEYPLDKDQVVAIKVEIDEFKENCYPLDSVYELNHIKGNYYQRLTNNLYLIRALTTDEILTLNNESLAYYIKVTKHARRYAINPLDSKNVNIIAQHDVNSKESYYLCDENYPEQLKDLVTFYRCLAPTVYKNESLPIYEDAVLKRKK